MTKHIGIVRMAARSAVAGGCLVLFSFPALAAPPAAVKPSVAELFKSGEAKYKAADYTGALADFTAADAAAPSVEAAREIGLCEDKLGHFRAADVAYNRFLAHPPAKLVDQVGPLVTRVREIEQMPGMVRVDVAASGASLSFDGSAETNPAPYEAQLPPGKHLVHASAPGHEALERELSVAFASKQDVTLTLRPVPAPPPAPAAVPAAVSPPPGPAPAVPLLTSVTPASPPPAVSRRTVAFAAAGVAVIGAGLAATFGALALSNKSDYQNNPTLSNSDQGNNDAAYADGAIALAVVAGITSVILFVTDDPDSQATSASAPPANRTSVLLASPFLTAHGGGAGALLRF